MVVSGLAVVSVSIEGTDYDVVCEDFTAEIENQQEDGSGVNSRWESAVTVKSRWNGSGNFKADDTLPSLLAKAASSDVEVDFVLNTGTDTITGTANLERVGRVIRNAGLQMVPISLRGVGAPVIS